MNRRTLAIVGAASVALAIALVVASLVGGGDDSGQTPSTTVSGSAGIAGLAQDGAFLGSPDAPYVLVEYADLQCPYCGQYATEIMPTIIDRYVRTDKLRLEFRGLAFLGPDSTSGLRIVEAAAAQDKLWNVLEALFAEQGKENGGWMPGAVDGLGDAVPGFDLAAARTAADSGAVTAAIATSNRLAGEDGVRGTPSFTIRPKGGTATPLEVKALDVASFESALESALAG